MARNINFKKGFTLIELVLYMGIFALLVSGVLYSSFYLQNIMHFNSIEYKANEEMYRHLALLQQYVKNAVKIEISTTTIHMHTDNGLITQELSNGSIRMKYQFHSKPVIDFEIYPYTQFTKFSFIKDEYNDSVQEKNRLKIEIERVNSRGEIRRLKEYIYLSKS